LSHASNQDAQNWRRIGSILICALVLVAHGSSIFGGFVWDDGYTVRDNLQIRDLSNAPGYFVESWGAGAPEDSHAYKKNRGLYRPLTQLSFAINHASAGLSPTAFHFTDLLIHLASALLLFMLAQSFCSPAFAAFAAIVWAVHPIHTEAIAVLSYRTTLLAGFFSIAALCVQTSGKREQTVLWVRTLLVACACLCKEDAIVLVAIIPLHDLWVRKVGFKPAVLRALPLGAVAVGYLAARAAIVTSSPFSFFADHGVMEQGSSLLQIFWMYARLLLLPFPLTPFYDWESLNLSADLFNFNAVAGACGGLLLFAGAMRWKKSPRTAFLSAALLISLLPYSHIIPFTVGAAERFLYMPSVFALFLIGLGASHISERQHLTPFLERLGMVLITSWVIIAMGWSAVRHTQWHSNRSILTATTRLFPESFNAWKSLGDTCRSEGSLEEALGYYATAQEAAPYPIAAYLEASTLLDLGRVAEARMRLDDFLRRNPALKTIDPKGMTMLGDLVDDLNQRLRK